MRKQFISMDILSSFPADRAKGATLAASAIEGGRKVLNIQLGVFFSARQTCDFVAEPVMYSSPRSMVLVEFVASRCGEKLSFIKLDLERFNLGAGRKVRVRGAAP